MCRPVMTPLIDALLNGDSTLAAQETASLLSAGVPRSDIIIDAVESAMAELDAKCTVEQFNLLEIMLCGRAVTGVMSMLYPSDEPRDTYKATVVVGTLEGDVHDLGKNICKTVLKATGYKVIDCGKDCTISELIEAAEAETALAIGVSGLISSVIPEVRRIKEALAERGLPHIKVLAGGAVFRQASAESLAVDFVAQTAFDSLHYLNSIIGDIDEQL